jgi:uncharacterized protein YcaQ
MEHRLCWGRVFPGKIQILVNWLTDLSTWPFDGDFMHTPLLTITSQTRRRFILGKQGLWPGRRWRGQAGAAEAMRAGVVVQVDPLNVLARSHEIVLHARVLDYSPGQLDALLYGERQFFDYGGTVMLHPMDALPCWRVVMARNAERRAYLGEQNRAAVAEVLAALRERGPLSNRDFASPPGQKRYWHAAKTTAQALYYLWLKGEVMTHSRRGFERRFDLAERIVPPAYDRVALVDEADDFFARQAFAELGLAGLKGWRGWWMGTIERQVAMPEAAENLEALLAAGAVVPVRLAGEEKDPLRYLLAADLPLLEETEAGRIPDAWQPLGPDTSEEAVFLAPLDIVSARGRALPIFGFDYKWEVYKPAGARRWGYYVLPVLYGDRLAARFDAKMDRERGALVLLGFWLEAGTPLDEPFRQALARGFRRFAAFAGAERVEWATVVRGDGPLELTTD